MWVAGWNLSSDLLKSDFISDRSRQKSWLLATALAVSAETPPF